MKNLLGIGSAGSNVVRQLAQFNQYVCYTIDVENQKNTKYNFKLLEKDHPEEYESSSTTKINKFLSKIEDNLSVFLCGASTSSALTLKLLEPLHKKGLNLEIIYFMPEREVLSEIKTLQEKATRNILQEYTRSGVFDRIYLVANETLEVLAGPTNVYEYFKQLNEVFVNSFYMLDIFKNSKPITSTFSKTKDSCRIATIGVASLEKNDSLFFPFSQEDEIIYYFGINEKKLKTTENLFRIITNKVKSRIAPNIKVSFGIYPTQYEDDYIYAEYYSSKIQEIDVDKQENV